MVVRVGRINQIAIYTCVVSGAEAIDACEKKRRVTVARSEGKSVQKVKKSTKKSTRVN